MSSLTSFVRLLRYAKHERASIISASIFSVINKIFDVLPEILIGIALDVVVNQENSFVARIGIESPVAQLSVLGFLTFLIWAVESATEYVYQIQWRNLAQRIQSFCRLDVYGHVQTLDMAFFDKRSSGDLVAVLNDDVNQLERFLDGGANGLIQIGVTVVVVGAVFLVISPTIALFAVLPIPAILYAGYFFGQKADPLYADVRNKVGVLSTRLSNNLQGMATIKSFTAEKYELGRMEVESDAYVRANSKAIAVSSAFFPLVRMGVLSGFLVTFVLGGFMALNGDLNVGAYGVLVFLTQRLLWPMVGLAQMIDLYARAMASVGRILDLKDQPSVSEPGHVDLERCDVKGALALRQLSFSYGEAAVLNNISLSVKAGGSLGIVGATGSGKSTLLKLLLKYYPATSGALSLDSHNYSDLSDISVRQAIGYVSQDVFLFEGTVRDNIAYGSAKASDAFIETVARQAEAWEFIERLPQGLDTQIGERGIRLSGGQRQRLSLARALLKDPPILILDEATSAIDNETEAAIQKSIAALAQTRTLIVVAHRLSTLVGLDEIVVLQNGQIVEQGSHTALVKAGGYYANQWSVQIGQLGLVDAGGAK